MGNWKRDANAMRQARDDDERRTYGAEQDYLHGLHVKRERSRLTDTDPGDEQQEKPRETAHNTEKK